MELSDRFPSSFDRSLSFDESRGIISPVTVGFDFAIESNSSKSLDDNKDFFEVRENADDGEDNNKFVLFCLA